MAKNLRSKIPDSDTLIVNDAVKAATTKFLDETNGTDTEAVGSPREVAERAVSLPILRKSCHSSMLLVPLHDESVLSMI